MANYDVIITNAGPYHNSAIGDRERLALKIYAQCLDFILTTDYTTAAGQKTLVAKAAKDMAGIPQSEFPAKVAPASVAIWFKAAEGGNLGLATASLSSKLAAIPYLLSLPDDLLVKTSAYMDGLVTSALS